MAFQWLSGKVQLLRNKVGFWCAPESEQLDNLESHLIAEIEENISNKRTIRGLNKAIGVLAEKEAESTKNSTIIIASLLATYGGTIKLDPNMIDAITSNKNLQVVIDDAESDGSRIVRLVESEPVKIDENLEPTDQELVECENEFMDNLYSDESGHPFIGEDDDEDEDEDDDDEGCDCEMCRH